MGVLNHILCCMLNRSNHLLDNAWSAWVMMMMDDDMVGWMNVCDALTL